MADIKLLILKNSNKPETNIKTNALIITANSPSVNIITGKESIFSNGRMVALANPKANPAKKRLPGVAIKLIPGINHAET